MPLSPKVLLSQSAKERCVANLAQLPAIIHSDVKPQTNASVLVPLCVVDGEVCLLYTLRSSNLKNHSGQVSFPGGKTDGEESAIDTALRETEEEIGLSRKDIDVWGTMAPVQGRNKDMLITPVVGEIKNFDEKNLIPNVHEVEEVFTVPMRELCNINNHAHLAYKPPLPIFMCKHKVWGITGLVTHMFLECFLPENLYKVDFMRKKFELHELMPSKL